MTNNIPTPKPLKFSPVNSTTGLLDYHQYVALKSSPLRADSYKYSQYAQYPDNATAYSGYIEARGSKLDLQEIKDQTELIEFLTPRLGLDDKLCVNRFPVFGLQGFLMKVLNNPITSFQVGYFDALMKEHGEPFNYTGFQHIVDNNQGRMPVTIHAIPEGTIVDTHTPLVTVEALDPQTYWFGGFMETQLHRAVWYPSTVSAISYTIKNIIAFYLEKTGDMANLPFKLHDFGMRGVSSEESGEIGGLAHLVNFLGTDTVDALIMGAFAYGTRCAGYSIPASEHSTMTALGPLGEYTQMLRMLNQFPQHGIVACVSDSFDFHKAVTEGWCGQMKTDVLESGKVLVIRPDSGDPVEINVWAVQELDKHFGHTVNEKGYKVLNNVRLIQGDGVCPQVIAKILQAFMDLGYSADNIAFGMGGALLQKLDRDTFKYAMKCSAMGQDGVWHDVYKDPKTDQGKRSLRGRVGAKFTPDGRTTHCPLEDPECIYETVWTPEDGLCKFTTLDTIRERASKGF